LLDPKEKQKALLALAKKYGSQDPLENGTYFGDTIDEPGMPKYNIARRNSFVVNAAVKIRKEAVAGIRIESSNTTKNTRR
jgi:hypothetical protein